MHDLRCDLVGLRTKTDEFQILDRAPDAATELVAIDDTWEVFLIALPSAGNFQKVAVLRE